MLIGGRTVLVEFSKLPLGSFVGFGKPCSRRPGVHPVLVVPEPCNGCYFLGRLFKGSFSSARRLGGRHHVRCRANGFLNRGFAWLRFGRRSDCLAVAEANPDACSPPLLDLDINIWEIRTNNRAVLNLPQPLMPDREGLLGP